MDLSAGSVAHHKLRGAYGVVLGPAAVVDYCAYACFGFGSHTVASSYPSLRHSQAVVWSMIPWSGRRNFSPILRPLYFTFWSGRVREVSTRSNVSCVLLCSHQVVGRSHQGAVQVYAYVSVA